MAASKNPAHLMLQFYLLLLVSRNSSWIFLAKPTSILKKSLLFTKSGLPLLILFFKEGTERKNAFLKKAQKEKTPYKAPQLVL